MTDSRRVWTADEIAEQADQLAAALKDTIVPASIGGFVGGFLFGTPLVPRKRKRTTTTERKDGNATDSG